MFLDEIDVLISKSFKNEFIGFIRSCYNRRADRPDFNRVAFCLLGVVAPADLIGDIKQTFNIGKDIGLAGLEFEIAEASFLQGLLGKVNNPKECVSQIFDWTGGQPFLTQKLCQLASENSENNNINISTFVEDNILKNWGSKSYLIKEHLQNISNYLLATDRGSDPISLLIILGEILDNKSIKYNSQDTEHTQLKLSGIIKVDSGNIEIFNKLYFQVFNKSWIEERLNCLPKTWFPQENLQDLTYSAPPSILMQHVIKLLDKELFVVVICLLSIVLVSLYSSYYLFSSPAWSNNFNRGGTGAYIEFIRSTFLILFAAYSFNDLFQEETREILTLDRLWWIRTCLGVLGFLFVIFISIHHLYLGPINLANKQPLLNHLSWFENYYLPYLFFLPCALVNFVAIGIPTVAVTIYSSIVNISTNIKSIRIFDKSMNKTKSYIQSYPLSDRDKEDINEQMMDAFQDLFTSFLKDFTRYFTLFLGVILLFVFELNLGRKTLEQTPLALTLIDYSFCWISLIVIFFLGIGEYQKIFRDVRDLLVKIKSDYRVFENEYNLIRLIRRGVLNVRNKKYIYALLVVMTVLSIVLYNID
ncbi:AAA-like domain-containing protein [Chamaesiphon polymorphus]|uniref:AAA-like domain-containing protein n=1 Tax=Chamaesiphon polymorphus TaxID=2107691 RepID=UPI002481BF48|nr:AAA-like domain-containing protein [Chamaesiphon polymorphus]